MITNKLNTTYQMLKVADLKVAKYQRPPQFSRIKEYSSNFNPNQLGVLTISFREGQYWIIDGQHRVLLLKSKGIPYAMCEVHSGLSYEEEAIMFEKINHNRKSVSTIERELALIESGNATAVLVSNILLKHGFTYGKGKSKNAIAAVSTVKTINRIMGVDILSKCLYLIRKCWDGVIQATDAEILMGVSLFIKNNPQFDEKMFIRKLSNIEPKVIIREGKSDITNTGKNLAGYRRFEAMVTKYYEKGNRKNK